LPNNTVLLLLLIGVLLQKSHQSPNKYFLTKYNLRFKYCNWYIILVYNIIFLITEKPSAPEGPLEVTDITGETVKLSWKPSKQDGGSLITAYVVELRETWKSKFRPVGKTSPDDLTFRVTGLKDGDEYFFRVCAENAVGLSDGLELKKPIKAETPKSKLWILICFVFFSYSNFISTKRADFNLFEIMLVL